MTQTEQHTATEADLNDYGQRMVEAAYRERSRPKCSREDFADGYVQALADCGHWALFATPYWAIQQRGRKAVLADE